VPELVVVGIFGGEVFVVVVECGVVAAWVVAGAVVEGGGGALVVTGATVVVGAAGVVVAAAVDVVVAGFGRGLCFFLRTFFAGAVVVVGALAEVLVDELLDELDPPDEELPQPASASAAAVTAAAVLSSDRLMDIFPLVANTSVTRVQAPGASVAPRSPSRTDRARLASARRYVCRLSAPERARLLGADLERDRG
jgi:cystathionine beta-lyase family protein involved in aluminum resistance